MSALADIRLRIKRHAIKKALRRPAPNLIPMSDPEGLRGRDYYLVHVGQRETKDFITATGLTADGATGYYPEKRGSQPREASMPNVKLAEEPVAITHYYREISITMDAWKWLMLRIFGSSKVLWLLVQVRRWLISKRKLVRQERYEVLQWLYQRELSHGNERLSPLDYVYLSNGQQWIEHPKIDEDIRYYDLLFESLEQSGAEIASRASSEVN